MLFNSLDFAIFFPIVFVLYWVVARHKLARNIHLLAASYFFYGWWDWRFLFLIIISSLVDYLVGYHLHQSEDKVRRKVLLGISLLVNLGFLVYFKYTNFFIETFVDSFRLFGKTLEVSTLNIVLPVGISFYTFQTLSYTIDIYRRQLKPTKDFVAFFTFVAFFPQLVAGPIERASHLLPQFSKIYTFNYQLVKSGLLLMAFGLFKKMVIADRLAVLVNQVYNSPLEYHGYEVIVATVFFAFQIYCDFSGYSDIAIGLARTMGFDLMKNFDSPYFSKSITEFWRRWHISLSTWFRDYVYIPLGGNRKGTFRTYLNLFLVFLVSGLWHGAAMTFVIWGAIHGLIVMLEKGLYPVRARMYNALGIRRDSLSNKLIFSGITFSIVCLSWIFFRANNLNDAFLIIRSSFIANYEGITYGGLYKLGLDTVEFWVAIISIAVLLLFDIFHKRKSAAKWLSSQNAVFRYLAYTAIVFVIILFGVYGDMAPQDFIYFQF
jgi:D-alanyl-lipoteichoic acid acyltransferase DltB (MBOAT superfamily)